MISSKNTLQEWFQKRNIRPLPLYEYKRFGGMDHEPKWVCTVKIFLDGKTTLFTSQPKSSKKESSLDAAKEALQHVHSTLYRPPLDVCTHSLIHKNPTLIVLDLENVPNAHKYLYSTISDWTQVWVVGFCSHSAHHVEEKFKLDTKRFQNLYPKLCSHIDLFVIPSTSGDAADIGLAVWLGGFIERWKWSLEQGFPKVFYNRYGKTFCFPLKHRNLQIDILTGDHFGQALVDSLVDTSTGEPSYSALLFHSAIHYLHSRS